MSEPNGVKGRVHFTRALPFLLVHVSAIVAPFRNPIVVTLSYGAGIDRVGSISDCKAGNTTLSCKEF